LIILDEPFEGLDPISSKIIQDNLKLMVHNGTTIFLTSHNLNLVEKLCTEVAIIHKGELILQSPTANIRNRIKSRMNIQKYSGLEELFLDLVSQARETKYLSWSMSLKLKNEEIDKMTKLSKESMEKIEGGKPNIACAAIGVFTILSGGNPVSLLFYLAA
jgi:ABC-type multidrug transport system ATPase subunit